VGQGTTGGCYEEVREGQIRPEGSLSQSGMLIGVGPGIFAATESSNYSAQHMLTQIPPDKYQQHELRDPEQWPEGQSKAIPEDRAKP
jgi:hypothetical protein